MQARRPYPALAVTAVAAALVLTVTRLVGGGAVEALVMTALAAGLAGMYRLRRYARAELLYRRSERRRRHSGAEPVDDAAVRGGGT